MMVLVGLLGFAQAQNNSNNTRMAPPAANQTEQRGPGAPNRQPAKTALESDCYSDAEKQLIREVAEKFEQRTYTGSHLTDAYAEDVAKLRAEDANIRFVHFKLGTVKSSEFGGPAKEHMATWPVAYRIAGIRDWLFEQRRSSRADSIHAELLNPAGKEVMVVAHWGDWHGTCENSLHAIQKAVEKGAKIATLQLQKTKDGQLVCFSDPTVERVTTGKGAVKDMTLAELRQLTVREYQGPEDLQRIPTLR